jgi:hypothetical protein
MSPAGLESLQDSSGKSANGGERAAPVQVNLPETDPELASLVEAWPTLPAETRAAILKLVKPD